MKLQNTNFIRNCAAIVAAITSVVVVWTIAYNGIFELLQVKWITALLSGIVVALVAILIDFGLRQELPEVLRSAITGEAWRDWRTLTLFILVLGLCVFRGIATGYLSWEGRKEAAVAALGSPDIKDVAQIQFDLNESEKERLARVDKEIKTLEKQIKNKEKEVEAKNKKLSALVAEGNGWAYQKMERLKSSATSSERTALDNNRSTRSKILGAENITTTVNAVNEYNQTILQEHEERKGRNSWLFGLLGIVGVSLLFVMSIIIALNESIDQGARRKRTVPPNIVPVKSGTANDDFKLERVTQVAYKNKDSIERIEERISVPRRTDKRSKKKNGSGTDSRSQSSKKGTDKRSRKRMCMMCKNDITDKRSDAQFCSPGCRKAHHHVMKKGR